MSYLSYRLKLLLGLDSLRICECASKSNGVKDAGRSIGAQHQLLTAAASTSADAQQLANGGRQRVQETESVCRNRGSLIHFDFH